MNYSDTPADMAKVIDPLKEWITYKWCFVFLGLILTFFSCFVSFCLSFVTGHFLLCLGAIAVFGIYIVLFLLYARTPAVMEENWRGIMHYLLIKIGFNTFSKYSRRVKKWVIQNYSGLVEMDEDTGLCKEKLNQDLY